MIDLSFLTDAEKEAILKVLNRDSELKKAEEQRIRHLQDEVNDENELKYKSGQWFYEAKSRRHRDKIHGADLVRASIRKRKNPATIELYGVMEPPDEAEEDRMPSNVKSIQSTIDRKIMNGTASPAKQRKNPFNLEGAVDEMDLHNEMSKPTPEPGLVNGQLGKKSGTEALYAVVKKPFKSSSPDQEKDKKPDTPSEKSNTKKDEDKLENPKEDTLAPLENSFPENAEKFKRMSQSVPTFLQDDVSGSVMSVYSGDFGNVDIKGNIEYSIEYVEQLKEFLIYIYQCKDLAAADVKKQRSDPYVKAYLLPEKAKMGKRKTAVKKKTLNPVYNEILRYKIPKESLQAQTLNLSVWHRDVLGRNSFLGEVNQDLANWEWENKQKNWYPLEPRTLASSIGLENRGEMKLSLQYIPVSPSEVGKKPNTTGEVHIWIRECIQLPMLRENKINSFVKCTILPDTSRKSRQKTRTVDKTPNPIFNHTMVYDGFKEDDLREACVELTVWDHNKLTNHFLGGIRIGQGTGKSYGTPVDWMDSSPEESTMWQKMIASPNTWIDGMLPLRMFKMAKLAK
ncbi:synaptotagmin-like protein 2 isoform X26 [Ranitomeya imitator]|uniref:synaptotagmin-like protein 2 isoform X26 n=1 Tax=Ranitomeya imitator TaxID=111125 RepID=UPI0037E85822